MRFRAASALFAVGLSCRSAGHAPVVSDAAADQTRSPARDAAAPADQAAPIDVVAPPPDLATDIDRPADATSSTAADAGPSAPVTFFAFGDPQYGGGPADKNSFHIQALNAAPDLKWPTGVNFQQAGQAVGDPRGVIIAGDLTQNGQAGRNPLGEWYTQDRYAIDLNQAYGAQVANPRVAAELGLFLRDYGLQGQDGLGPYQLKWRVFEGYGNHDFDVLEKYALLYGNQAPAHDVVSVRNLVRAKWPELRRFAPGTAGHYSWDWGRAHFVHLNLVAADSSIPGSAQIPRDPSDALAFLKEDLAGEVGTSCRPVVVVMHYGFDPFSDEALWWDDSQRLAFLDAIAPYDVIAILHGHVHETRAYQTSDGKGKSYDVFSLGSPYYDGQMTNGGRGHFAVFRLTDTHLDAADISWLPANPSPEMADGKDIWTGKTVADLRFQITTTFADGWGGWSYSKDLPPCRR